MKFPLTSAWLACNGEDDGVRLTVAIVAAKLSRGHKYGDKLAHIRQYGRRKVRAYGGVEL